MRRLCCLSLLALLVGVTPLGAQFASPDPDLKAGIHDVESGDFESALAFLGRAVRTLSSDASRSQELAQAHLYLGIAYVYLDQEKAGRASFREALKLRQDLRLSADKFPPKVMRVFGATVHETQTETASAPGEPAGSTAAAPAAIELAFWNSIASSKNARDFEEYLRQYPSGSFAGLARNRIEELRATRRTDSAAETRPPAIGTTPREPNELEDLLAQATATFNGSQQSRSIVLFEQIASKLEPLRASGALTPHDRQVLLRAYEFQGRAYVTLGLQEKALEMSGKACDAGGENGCAAVDARAFLHLVGHKSVKKDQARAAGLFGRVCDAGYAPACAHLALLYKLGKGVQKNQTRALELYRKACDGGDADGCTNAKDLR